MQNLMAIVIQTETGYYIKTKDINRSLWASFGSEGAWNLVPWQSKLRHNIWKFW